MSAQHCTCQPAHHVNNCPVLPLSYCSAGRQLASIESASSVPKYLLPTFEPPLCTGSSCCQSDDYASPYRIRFLNSSQSLIGDSPNTRTYTTFFFLVLPSFQCHTDLDNAGCCQGSISSIWVDVGE